MRGFVEWMAAEAEGETEEPGEPKLDESSLSESDSSESATEDASWEMLPADNFPTQPFPDEERMEDDPLDRNPDLWLYRKRTVGLLRRYMRFSLETGRLPSFVGREFFRARVSYYTAATFEDRVIFVRDMERSLARLEYWDQQLIVRIILQEHSQGQTARILQCNRKTVQRRLPVVLDLLSEDFLKVGLLAVVPPKGESSR
jgi:DNA-directed RNA polymerase specialized sigma24 family protein